MIFTAWLATHDEQIRSSYLHSTHCTYSRYLQCTFTFIARTQPTLSKYAAHTYIAPTAHTAGTCNAPAAPDITAFLFIFKLRSKIHNPQQAIPQPASTAHLLPWMPIFIFNFNKAAHNKSNSAACIYSAPAAPDAYLNTQITTRDPQ